MAQMSTAGKVVIAVAAAGAVFLAWRSAKAAKSAKKNGVTPGPGPLGPVIPGTDVPSGSGSRTQNNPKGKIVPGKDNEGAPPLPKGWGGGQYGPGPVPADFDWNGNLIFIAADCMTIAEPTEFLPRPGTQEELLWWMPVNGGASAQANLALALSWLVNDEDFNPINGTAWGYIARLVARRARDELPLDKEAIEEICLIVWEEALTFQAVMPACPSPFDVNAMKNTPAFAQWWKLFVERVTFGINQFKVNWYQWNPLWEVE